MRLAMCMAGADFARFALVFDLDCGEMKIVTFLQQLFDVFANSGKALRGCFGDDMRCDDVAAAGQRPDMQIVNLAHA